MGKKGGLSSNPAEAARKAARQRELKKNKADREAVREHALVKKDTSTLEGEIRHLEKNGKIGPELEALKTELKRAREAKDKYLEKHPEHKKFIYPHSEEAKATEGGADNGRGLFRPDGKPRFPERSVYYHPTFNPWGAPPPGLSYVEKPPHEWASSSQIGSEPPLPTPAVDVAQATDASDEDEEDDDGIVMPSGPPPGSATNASDDDDGDDDGIVMPSGPPPSNLSSPMPPLQAQASVGTPSVMYSGPPPGYSPRPPLHSHIGAFPGSHYATPGWPTARPSYSPPFPQSTHAARPSHPYARPPSRAYLDGLTNQPRPVIGPPDAAMRPRPPANAPAGPSSFRSDSTASVSAAPSITKPASTTASATITSAPQLRDLKKEAVAFLPPSVRSKKSKATQKAKMAGLSGTIRANPDVGEEEGEAMVGKAKSEVSEAASGMRIQAVDQRREDDDEEERREPEVSLSAAQAFVPSVREVAGVPPQRVEAPPPSVVTAKSAPVMPSLVAYYDSDEEGSDQDEADGSTAVTKMGPDDQNRQEQQLRIQPGDPANSARGGRINLVEALKMQLPTTQSSGKKKDGDGDYEKWLQSIGGS